MWDVDVRRAPFGGIENEGGGMDCQTETALTVPLLRAYKKELLLVDRGEEDSRAGGQLTVLLPKS
jgi:hypothetical protein